MGSWLHAGHLGLASLEAYTCLATYYFLIGQVLAVFERW